MGIHLRHIEYWAAKLYVEGPRRCHLMRISFLLATGADTAGRGAEDKLHIDASSFRCIAKMMKVRQFYVGTLLGNLDLSQRSSCAIPYDLVLPFFFLCS
jgi:hypothetical protein